MKIVHVIDYFQPKLGYQETFLIKEQMKAGHDVSVITSDRYFPFSDYNNSVQAILGDRILKPGRYIEEGITVYRLPIYFEIYARAALKNLGKRVIELKPDAIHGHNSSTLIAVQLARLKRKLGCTLLIDDHMLYSVIQQNLIIKRIFYFLFRVLFSKTLRKYTDHFIAVTNETRRLMHQYYGIPKERITFFLIEG